MINLKLKPISDLSERAKTLTDRLRAGNERFVTGAMKKHDFSSQRADTRNGQSPDIIIMSCTDSRIVPNYIFDGEIGEFFIVRKAGNVIGPTSLGSIELAADHLAASMLLVLGHQSCGAVNAAITGYSKSKHTDNIVKFIQPALDYALSLGLKGEELADKVTWKNVRVQMRAAYSHSDILRKLVEAGKFAIIGGIYSLETGHVDILEEGIF